MKEFLAGIDISKEKVDVCILKLNATQPLGFSVFKNTPKGFSSMLSWGKSLGIIPENCLFGFEHTGVYSLPLAYFLEAKNLTYCIESGLQILQSSGVKRGKSDKMDAHVIANYLSRYQNEIKPYRLPSSLIQEMKVLFSYRKRLVKMKVALGTASGEIMAFTDEKATQSMTGSAHLILDSIRQGIKEVEKTLEQLVRSDDSISKNYDLVCSVPGVGSQTAIAMLVLTDNFKLFANARKFARFAGVAPFSKQSGKSIYMRAKVSKIANGQMKSLLSMCAGAAIRTDSQTQQYYNKKKAEGKPEGAVRNAIMNKIIHRVFAVVKRGTAFVPLGQHAKV